MRDYIGMGHENDPAHQRAERQEARPADPRLIPGNCHKCGLPRSDNPHPEAGKPPIYLEVGCPKECIPCLVLSRHQWAQRAMKAENELKDINTLSVNDLTESAPPFTGWRWATEQAISAWGQAMKHGDKDVLDLAKKVKRQLDMMVEAPHAGTPVDLQAAAYDYLNEKGVSHIGPSHLVEFAQRCATQEPAPQPVATLHDDGHYVWKGAKPHDFNYAGWRMEVYAALPPALAREVVVPLTEPVSVTKALLGGVEAKVVTSVEGSVAAFLVNIQLTGWNVPKEHAEGFVRGFNYAAKWMHNAMKDHATPLPAITTDQRTALEAAIRIMSNGNNNRAYAGYLKPLLEAPQEVTMPTGGDKEYWHNMYEQERDCRMEWKQKASDVELSDTDILNGAADWRFDSRFGSSIYSFSPVGFLQCVRKILKGTK